MGTIRKPEHREHHPRQAKQIARMKYAERQIEKFFKWSWEVKGEIKYKDIKQLQDKYNIECYAESRTRK